MPADYQTVFAQRQGAVAAPTAGLHFTPELLADLETAGVHRVTVTLHVGIGTFLPVRVDHIADHRMHAERGVITAADGGSDQPGEARRRPRSCGRNHQPAATGNRR